MPRAVHVACSEAGHVTSTGCSDDVWRKAAWLSSLTEDTMHCSATVVTANLAIFLAFKVTISGYDFCYNPANFPAFSSVYADDSLAPRVPTSSDSEVVMRICIQNHFLPTFGRNIATGFASTSRSVRELWLQHVSELLPNSWTDFRVV